MKLTVNDLFRLHFRQILKIDRQRAFAYEDLFRLSIPCSQQSFGRPERHFSAGLCDNNGRSMEAE